LLDNNNFLTPSYFNQITNFRIHTTYPDGQKIYNYADSWGDIYHHYMDCAETSTERQFREIAFRDASFIAEKVRKRTGDQIWYEREFEALYKSATNADDLNRRSLRFKLAALRSQDLFDITQDYSWMEKEYNCWQQQAAAEMDPRYRCKSEERAGECSERLFFRTEETSWGEKWYTHMKSSGDLQMATQKENTAYRYCDAGYAAKQMYVTTGEETWKTKAESMFSVGLDIFSSLGIGSRMRIESIKRELSMLRE